MDELRNKVDNKTALLIADEGSIETGGGRATKDGKIIYGPSRLASTVAPKVKITLICVYTGPIKPLTKDNPLTLDSDDSQLNIIHRGGSAAYSVEGKEWKNY